MVIFSKGCDEYNFLANFIHEFFQITTEGGKQIDPLCTCSPPGGFLSEFKFQIYFSSSFRVSQREFLALQPEYLKINCYRIISSTLLESFKMGANRIPDLSVLLASFNIPEFRGRSSRIEDSYQWVFRCPFDSWSHDSKRHVLSGTERRSSWNCTDTPYDRFELGTSHWQRCPE